MTTDAWSRLVEAHDAAERRTGGGNPSTGRPTAAILACSDARVPPSVVFDQPAGSLFVIRIAGNTAVPAARASLDYAVTALDIDTIVVMGHTDCGAVRAAVEGTCGGHLEPVVAPICALAADHPEATPDEIAFHHVARTVRALRAHDGPVGRGVAAGEVDVRGAIHDLETGRLEAVHVPPSTCSPSALEATP